eukprot:gene2249-2772_t
MQETISIIDNNNNNFQKPRNFDQFKNEDTNNKSKTTTNHSSLILPLVVDTLPPHRLHNIHTLPWKLNLIAISPDKKKLFIAESQFLSVYDLNNPSRQLRQINLDNNNMTVNQIRIGKIEDEDVLITVDEGGFVRLFFVNDIDRPPLMFFNAGVSTWGIAICRSKPLFAVSANNFKATMWNLNDEHPQQTRKTFIGHNHNIPCIDFSPDGNYLVTISIDKFVRIWDVNNQTTISMLKLSQWGWGCRWINLREMNDEYTIRFLNDILKNGSVGNNKMMGKKEWRGLTRQEEMQEPIELNDDPQDPVNEDEELDDDIEDQEDDDDDEFVEPNNQTEQQQQQQQHNLAQLPKLDQVKENDDDNEEEEEQQKKYKKIEEDNENMKVEEEEEDQEEEKERTIEEEKPTIEEENNNDEEEMTLDEEIEYNKKILEKHQEMIDKVLQSDGITFKLINSSPNRNPLPSHLVFSTFQNLYLSSYSLENLMMIPNPTPTSFPIAQTQIDRISFLEVVPELSMSVVASQGPARKVVIFRITKDKHNNPSTPIIISSDGERYSMTSETILPPPNHPSIIVGISLVRNESPNPSEFSVNLYILYMDGTFLGFNIRRSNIANNTTSNLFKNLNSTTNVNNNSTSTTTTTPNIPNTSNNNFGLDISSLKF